MTFWKATAFTLAVAFGFTFVMIILS